MAVVVTTFGGLAITLTIRRESGILKRMRGTPLPPSLYLGALIASIVVVLAAESVIVLLLGHLAFDVPLPARPSALVAVIALGAACFSALGVALSSFVPNADGSSAVVNAVYLPMLFLSGAFFPVEKMPAVVQGVADALPLTHLLDVMRALFAGGPLGSAELAGLGVLLAWGAFGLVVAIRSFSWEPRGQ
jgi:ABC-2 type transport system permease protein